MTELNQSWNHPLNDQQSEFLQSFLADNAPRYQRLIAPPGTGKTTVATIIIQELVRRKGAKKILCLLPARAIVEHYKERLEQLGLGLPIEYVDLRRFRELLTNIPLDASPWPTKILVLLDIGTTKSSEVLEAVLKAEWDLIVSDSVPYQGNRSKVLTLLLERRNATRMLILDDDIGQNLSKGGVEYRSHKIETTRWAFNAKQYTFASDIEIKLHVVDYLRSPEEADFIRSYLQMQEYVENTPFNHFFRLRLVSSSLYATEQSLRQIRNKFVHQGTLSFLDIGEGTGLDSDLVEEENYRVGQPDKTSFDPSQLVQNIQQSLDVLNRVSADSKFDAFMNYIKNECQGKHVLVQSSYASTISFLYSNLSEERDDVYQIVGSFSREYIFSTLDKFRREGGVLIASTAVSTGIDLELDELVFYDIISNPVLIIQCIGRLYRHNQLSNQVKTPTQKKIIAFKDKTKAIPSEENRLRQLQRIVRQISQ